jgi:antitoxin YefM
MYILMDKEAKKLMTQMTISEARNRLTALPKELAQTPEHWVCVTVHGQPELAVMSWDLYESLAETLDVLGDPELMNTLRTSIAEMEAGQLIDHDEIVARHRR